MKRPINTYQNIALKNDLPIEQIIATSQELDLSFVLYRLPFSNSNLVLIDLSGTEDIIEPELETMVPGFLFSPFEAHTQQPKKFIKANVIFKERAGKYELFIDPKLNSGTKLDTFLQKVNEGSSVNEVHNFSKNGWTESVEHSKSEFLTLVERAIQEVNRDVFQKVVISRNKSIPLPAHFQPLNFYRDITNKYANALVYLISIPGTGSWIGATPEVLLSLNRDKEFITSALAGTQAFNPKERLADIAWTQKEIEEQAMVSRYIINCFKKIRLREFEEIGPRTIQAGNLVHLMTKYTVDMQTVNFPQLGTVMLQLLHPTSAICGMPKNPAMEFIRKHEGFDREYFTGYLGPVNLYDEINLFVNLRCMKIVENKARAYAGAGITAYSDPEKEWKETEMKMNTLLNVL